MIGEKDRLVQAPVVGNIPIDLLKALVLIADLGSVTRAARALGISQSAVSAQMRRLEGYASGAVFIKQGRGVQLSDLGKRISPYARRIVAMSDQLQTVLAAGENDRSVRVGLPTGIDQKLIARAFAAVSSVLDDDPLITCDSTANLLRLLEAGFIDVAFLLDIAPITARVAVEWTERWRWIKAPDFVLSPGAPVPLVSCPGSLPIAFPWRRCAERAPTIGSHSRPPIVRCAWTRWPPASDWRWCPAAPSRCRVYASRAITTCRRFRTRAGAFIWPTASTAAGARQ
ncbi:MAG: LysR family transcriptional regulator [Xanthobacteraceae bacterium]|nr:LysR family transcriptional regulator [Xanthobacteraceae bacterium]